MTRNHLLFPALAACALFVTACDQLDGLLPDGRPSPSPPPADGCLYDGKLRREGETFLSKDGCNSCSCAGGDVACTLKACATPPPPSDKCVRTGCSGQLCLPESRVGDGGTTCEWRPEYACYRGAACERQPDGACGFTPTPELAQCLKGGPQGCDYDGKHYATGATFPATDGCNSCSCGENGLVACTLKACIPGPSACRRTGCSGQICADQDVASTCEWRPEYGCYKSAACERQANGACGFTASPELEQCLSGAGQGCDYNGTRHAPGASFPSTDGCNICSCGSDGTVACTKRACIPPGAGACRRTGCSGQICADQDVASTCEWRAEYACYQKAACERQPDGACGFTPSDALKVCVAAAAR